MLCAALTVLGQRQAAGSRQRGGLAGGDVQMQKHTFKATPLHMGPLPESWQERRGSGKPTSSQQKETGAK